MADIVRRKHFGVQTCTHCPAEIHRNSRFKGVNGLNLCVDCWKSEVEALLHDLDPDEVKVLRRRVVDHIRKSDPCLIRLAADLAASGFVKISDLI